MNQNFLKDYVTERGLSTISKAEYEKIVFYTLIFVQNICGLEEKSSTSSVSSKDIYTIAEKLKIKPSKVSALLKDIFYSDFEKSEMESPTALEIICKYISKDRFEKEELAILISNPVEQEIVERFLLENNVRYDTSFNRKIIKIPFTVLDEVFNAEKKQKILEKMKSVSGAKTDLKIESINTKGKFVETAKSIVKFTLETAVQSAVQTVIQTKH